MTPSGSRALAARETDSTRMAELDALIAQEKPKKKNRPWSWADHFSHAINTPSVKRHEWGTCMICDGPRPCPKHTEVA